MQILPDEIYQYYRKVAFRESALLKQLREETAQLPCARMQVAPEQGQYLHLLVKLINAKKIIEIGTFTGYSSICMATALPDDGQLIACDVSAKYTDMAKRYWHQAGLTDKITLYLGEAETTLVNLMADHANTFDLAFIDADKNGYNDYYECCLRLLKTGGVIVLDNMLSAGKFLASNMDDQSTMAQSIRALNEKIHQDERVELCLIPIGSGMMLARKC
ncbi:MAG: class I SAM-dependent methyltransferase [Pseudomonadota bacterium]